MSYGGTTVTFMRRSDGVPGGYSASGHSGYDVSGSDIVCAAISALTQTIANGLQNVLKVPINIVQDDDGAYFETILRPEASAEDIERAQVLFETLLQGLQAIRMEYPRNLRIIFRERR